MIINGRRAFLVSAALLAIVPQTESAPSTAAVVTDLAYITPRQLSDIGGGRKMNIYCLGHGAPAVIFDAGLGDQMRAWATIQPEISKRTRACAYDRAGLGFSDPSNRAGSADYSVDDLHKLLSAASVAPPYVLVGHSLGGMYVRLFAGRYRSTVVGMVLVDPVSEGQGLGFYKLDPETKAQNAEYVAAIHDECIPAAAKGFDTGSDAYKFCVGGADPHYSAAFNESFAANKSSVVHFQAVWSEWINVFTTSSDQVRAAKLNYGDMPLIVLSRAPFALLPNETQAMRDAKNALWMKLHDEIAASSTRGVNRVVPGAGHFIQLEKPDAVIEAINEVLDQVSAR